MTIKLEWNVNLRDGTVLAVSDPSLHSATATGRSPRRRIRGLRGVNEARASADRRASGVQVSRHGSVVPSAANQLRPRG